MRRDSLVDQVKLAQQLFTLDVQRRLFRQVLVITESAVVDVEREALRL